MSEKYDVIKKMEILASLLLNLEKLVVKHVTPAFLLLANGYLHLLRMYREKLKDLLMYDHFASQNLWKNLLLAELKESESEHSIHNAYFGKGLSMSNSMQLETLSDIKKEAYELIADESIISYAEKQAHLSLLDHECHEKLMSWKGE